MIALGGHGHHRESVGNPGAEARPAGVVLVVVNGVVVPRESGEEEEAGFPQRAARTSEPVAEREVIEVELIFTVHRGVLYW